MVATEAYGMRAIWIVAALVLSLGAARADNVLRVVPQSDLRVLDPHATQATITRIHGMMIYDTLYAPDEKLQPRPQMVASSSVSDDKLTYTFTLRPKLFFDNGQPVTTADVLASIPRAARQDPLMQVMMKRVAALEAVDATTFRIRLSKPFPYVENALAANGAFILRAEDIAAAGNSVLSTTTGSGPFRFIRDAYVPGAKIVYDRNPHYVPRDEPADGLAGGKRVLVDRVEWLVIPDLQTRVAALVKGEVDLLDQLPHDGIQSLKSNNSIEVAVVNPLGNQAFMRMNTLFPPFNDIRARQAMAMVVQQSDYLSAAFTNDPAWWRECFAYLGCGTPNGTEAGSDAYRKPDLARAKALLAEAGYKGGAHRGAVQPRDPADRRPGRGHGGRATQDRGERGVAGERLGHAGGAPGQAGTAGTWGLEPVQFQRGRAAGVAACNEHPGGYQVRPEQLRGLAVLGQAGGTTHRTDRRPQPRQVHRL